MLKYIDKLVLGGLGIYTAICCVDGYGYVSPDFNGYDPGREYNATEYYGASFKTNRLGLYELSIDAYEIPSNEWLPIVDESYFKTSNIELQTEIDNQPPSARYNAQGITKVDVVFATGELDQMEQLQNYTATFKAKLDAAENHFDTQVTAVETVTGGFDMEDADASTIYNFWDQYPNPNNYLLYRDYICNLYGRGGTQRFESAGTNDYNQVFIESESYDVEDFEFNFDMKLHGCGVGSGAVFHWNKDNDSAYLLIAEYRNKKLSLFYVPDFSRYVGQYYVADGSPIGTLLKSWSCSPKAAYPSNMAVESGNYSRVSIKMVKNKIDISFDGQIFTYTATGSSYIPYGGIGLWAGCCVAYTNVSLAYDKTITKSLGEAIQDVAWRDGSVRFVVHATDIIPQECDPSNPDMEADYAYTVAKLLNANCYLVNLGNNINEKSLNKLVEAIQGADGTEKGVFYHNKNRTIIDAMNLSADYIIKIAGNFNKAVDWVLVNTEILWNTIYKDSEKDPPLNLGEHNGKNAQPQDKSDIQLAQSWGLGNAGQTLVFQESKILAEKWRYRHYNSFFDNSTIQVSWDKVWMEDPVSIFEYPGKYRINYKRRDNPFYPDVNLENAFDSYRYWSTDYDYRVDND